MADRERTQLGHIVIFLDLRQVAAAIQFVTLSSNELTYDQLDGLLPRRPPHGWRMVVKGGRRHSEHLVVQHGETLQVGFVHVSVLVPDFDSDSSLGGSDDAEEESEEEEEDPTSNASTRSRSLRRGMSPTKPEPSSDHSYEPGPSYDNLRKQHDTAFFHAWSIPDVVSDTLCDGQPWALFEDLPNLVSTAQACKGLSYVGCMIDHRVPDVGPGPNTHLGGHGRDGRGWQELGLPPEDGGLQGTDPPEFQIPRPQAGQGQLQPVTDTAATFLIYAFEYAPEVLRVRLQFPAGIEHVTHVLQQAREELAARRQPCLVPVHPQPAADYGIFLATPAWTRDVYVLYDLTRLNGTIFSAHISPAVDRASILSVADVDSHLDVQVFVHDLPRPLQQHEVVRVSTGYCISIVPRQHPPFAVASLADMLLSSAGWNAQIVLPLAPDRWLHVLTDTEPCRFRLDPARRLYLRNDLADMLAYEVEDLTVQPAQPRILDHLDYGVRAHSVVVATQLLARRAEASEIRTIFLLDMRPITAGLAWGVANHGRVRAESLVARFDSQCPAGYRSQITGGRPLHTDEGLYFEVRPGEVLYVDYVARDVVSSDTEDDHTPDPSGLSPSPGGDNHSSSSDSAASSQRSRPSRLHGARDTGSETMHPRDGTSYSENREECQTFFSPDASRIPSPNGSGGRVVMWSGNSFSGFAEIVGWHATSVLPASHRHHGLLACVVVLCSLLILLGQGSRNATLPYGWGAAFVAVLINARCRRLEAAFFAVWLCSLGLPAAEAMHIPPFSRVLPVIDMPKFGNEQPCPGTLPCSVGHPARRPIPTPSRSKANVPSLRSEAYPGPTLLEQSVSLPENTAFFEARILLDTLVEHFGWEPSPFPGPCEDSRGGHSHQAPLGCKQLRLSEHLPARQYDLTQCELCLGRTLDEAVEIASCPWDLARSLPDSIRVHPATAEQLATSAALTGYPENSFVLFTDGSFNGSVSSWVCGSLVSAWHRNHSAIEAERSAIFWALVWALRAPRGYSVFLQGDNLAALGQAAGTCGGP